MGKWSGSLTAFTVLMVLSLVQVDASAHLERLKKEIETKVTLEKVEKVYALDGAQYVELCESLETGPLVEMFMQFEDKEYDFRFLLDNATQPVSPDSPAVRIFKALLPKLKAKEQANLLVNRRRHDLYRPNRPNENKFQHYLIAASPVLIRHLDDVEAQAAVFGELLRNPKLTLDDAAKLLDKIAQLPQAPKTTETTLDPLELAGILLLGQDEAKDVITELESESLILYLLKLNPKELSHLNIHSTSAYSALNELRSQMGMTKIERRA